MFSKHSEPESSEAVIRVFEYLVDMVMGTMKSEEKVVSQSYYIA